MSNLIIMTIKGGIMQYDTYESIEMNINLPVKILHIDSKSQDPMIEGIDMSKVNYIPRHWHRSLELTYVIDVSVQLNSLNEKRIVNKDEMLVVNSRIIHEVSTIPNTDVEVICLLISYDFLKDNIPGFDKLTYKINNDLIKEEGFKELFLRMRDNSLIGDLDANLMIKSDLMLILSKLNRNHLTDIEL